MRKFLKNHIHITKVVYKVRVVGHADGATGTAVPLMRTSVKMLSEVAVGQPSICAAAEQAGGAGTGSFPTI